MCQRDEMKTMKPTRITPTHVTIPSLNDLVLLRSPTETLGETLARLARYGVPTDPSAIELVGNVRSD